MLIVEILHKHDLRSFEVWQLLQLIRCCLVMQDFLLPRSGGSCKHACESLPGLSFEYLTSFGGFSPKTYRALPRIPRQVVFDSSKGFKSTDLVAIFGKGAVWLELVRPKSFPRQFATSALTYRGRTR